MIKKFCTPQGLGEIASAFFGALTHVVSTTAGFCLREAERPDGDGDFAAILNFTGENSGFLLIDADIPTLLLLTSYMTGCDAQEITTLDMSDCLCEIANMTGGNAKAMLAKKGFGFALTTPFVITGENKQICFKKDTTVLRAAFADDQIRIGIRVVIY